MRRANRGAWLGAWAWLVISVSPLLADESNPTETRNLEQLFQRLDADGDGYVRMEDVPSSQRRLIERLLRTSDRDTDQRLNLQEFISSLSPQSPDKPVETLRENTIPGADALKVLLVWLDGNQDGKITRGEAQGDLLPIFNELAKVGDRNKDGILSRPELGRSGPQMARVAMRIVRREDVDLEEEMNRIGEARLAAMTENYERDGPLRLGDFADDPEAIARIFSRLDENDDAQISMSELPGERHPMMRRQLKRIDRDGNGALDREEFATAIQLLARLEKMRRKGSPGEATANDDKRLDRPGGAQGEPGRSSRQRELLGRLMRLDADGDGRLSRKEVPQRLRNRFKQADANGDGLLDTSEIERAVRILARNRNTSD